jgi:AmmeMemoRadiSam system protein B
LGVERRWVMRGYMRMRYPAVAGAFYPSDPDMLRQMISRYLEAAPLLELGKVRGAIAPHAGYIYSGPVAAYTYRQFQSLPPVERTVFLIGPAHYVYVSGVAVGTYFALETPLGEVKVDVEKCDELLSLGAPFVPAPEAHEPEHSLEVQLPFLQVTMPGDFKVVPLLVGEADPSDIAVGLMKVLGDEDVLLVSSDLSHYHRYDDARAMDTRFLKSVLNFDFVGAARGEACGIMPILSLMIVAKERGWKPHLLDYRNSGDTSGDRVRVVGYGSVVYTEE